MKQGKFYTEIDEVTYDRQELEDLYQQHKHPVMNFGDYMQFPSEKREFKGRPWNECPWYFKRRQIMVRLSCYKKICGYV